MDLFGRVPDALYVAAMCGYLQLLLEDCVIG
jgi:hypothetical protein